MYCSTVYVKLLWRSNTSNTLLKPYSSSLLSRTYVVSQTYREHYFVEKSWLRLFTFTLVVCLLRHGICLATPHIIKGRQHDESTPFIKILKLSRGWLMTAYAEWLHSTDALDQRVPPLASKHKWSTNLKCYSNR